jgi:small-conductance mechanosensitive channel
MADWSSRRAGSLSARAGRSRLALALGLLALLLALLPSTTPAAAQAPKPPPGSASGKAESDKAKPPAQTTLPPEVAATVGRWAAVLTEVEKALQRIAESAEELADLRAKVEDVLETTTQTAETLRPQLTALRSQIEKLGPAPAKDGPEEAPEVAAERSKLSGLAGSLDGAIRQSELTWVRARQLVERITAMRHSLFTKNLMERQPSPVLPGVWRQLASDTTSAVQDVKGSSQLWWERARTKQNALALLVGSALLAYVLLKLLMAWWTDRRRLRTEPPMPTFFERAVSVSWVAPLRALPAFAAALLLYVGLDALVLLPGDNAWGHSAPAILKGILIFSAVTALISAVLARAPQWRLGALDDLSARRIARLLGAITAVYALDGTLTEVARAFSLTLSLTVLQSFLASTAMAALLIGLLLTPFTPKGAEAAVSRHAPAWLKLPLWVGAVGIMGAALLGYVALARFAAQQLVLTGIVVLVGWLGYLAIRAFTRETPQRGLPVGELLERRFGLDAPRRDQLARLTELALTFALVVGLLPVLMLQWGFSGADIRDWLKSLLFGVEIGQFRISLVRILAGIVLFIALLFATRLFQRWLRERMLASRMDAGIANSIETVVGYACTALAALLAVSYAGFDITSLALVAGALSLGIGFGLQSIVNNFVSGLILLIERPIKVGDRIVIGDQQGYVRRISVRATEVETFDRASVIVPNSELITGRVVNWTHRDWLGSVNVKIGVSYHCDPEQVIAILKKCAEDHPLVLGTPAPGAALESFGDSALMFNLRISLADIDKAYGVQSDLRVAIFKALREAGIEIPFNQLDVNMRDLEAVKAYLSDVLEKRPNGSGREPRAHGAAASPHAAAASRHAAKEE